MAWPESIRAALERTPGAVFRRCALQVNPFEYLIRQGRQTPFTDEPSYNAAMVDACREAGIDVVGISDHHNVSNMRGLRAALTAAGVVVFPGFEAKSKDGVHALVLFEPTATEEALVRRLGEIGARDLAECNGLGKFTLGELLALWDDVVIVAGQLTSVGGLLKVLSGQPRKENWCDPRLIAGAISRPVRDIEEEGIRRILENKDGSYHREHPIALIYANDICDRADFEKDNTSTWLKMTEPTVTGLKSAFRDHQSRVRLPGEHVPAPHAKLLAAAWTGGFLDGQAMRFSDNLNVLIGGRGTGKSTLIESLRWALDISPLGTAAARTHQQVIDKVLGASGTVRVLVSSPSPSPATYLIERYVGQAPVVRNASGVDLGLAPRDIIAATFWGQHEIAELELHTDKRIELITRFARSDPSLPSRKTTLRTTLARNREQLARVEDELESTNEQLAALPTLEEQQRRYQEAGVEERLREQSLSVREENLLRIAADRLAPLRDALSPFPDAAQPDRAFLAPAAVQGLPNAELLAEADAVLDRLTSAGDRLVKELATVLEEAERGIEAVRKQWRLLREQRQEEFNQRLRELHSDQLDGSDFLRVRHALEGMLPLRERAQRLSHEQQLLEDERQSLLAEWVALRDEEFQAIKAAATFANSRLHRQVRVETVANGETAALMDLLKETVGGRLDRVGEAIEDRIDPVILAEWCKQGPAVLMENLATHGMTENQARRLCGASPSARREIEELDLPPRTEIQLNLRTASRPWWRSYDSLSKGQKATAALLLLLLGDEAAGPLVVDQPEDDLDNAFIFETIVPSMRDEKRHRQFLFASHDPNIPVLGDAELIAVLSTEIVHNEIVGRIGDEGRLGSIDVPEVREAVEENLEGGRSAFERRRRMYGF